ncbi:hypothetical protein [Rhizobium grahamii]|uniref:hypothetical protein n=1 Tax=Rhizobium grahamii TaxID=1120045 RepID=UPI0016765D67|nr:hypothetical protein [Rhizobium grahamii]
MKGYLPYVIGASLGAIFAIAVSILFGLDGIFQLAVLALLPVRCCAGRALLLSRVTNALM